MAMTIITVEQLLEIIALSRREVTLVNSNNIDEPEWMRSSGETITYIDADELDKHLSNLLPINYELV